MNLKKAAVPVLILLFVGFSLSQVDPDAKITPPSNEADSSGTPKEANDDAGENANKDGKSKHKKQKCHKKALEGFGFVGESHAKEMELVMCPSVKNSCCTKEDQLMMYERWVIDKEGEDLKNRLDFQAQVR